MTHLQPFLRKARHPVYRGLEALESRLLLDSTLIPVTDHRDLVVDPTRNQLLIVGSAGTINRYDISSGQLLTPIDLGFAPGGADITPDGQYLYVTHLTASSTLTLTRVNLATGTFSDFTTSVNPNAGLYDCAVLADGRVELTTTCDTAAEVFLKFDPTSVSFLRETALNTNIYISQPASIFTSSDLQSAFFIEPRYSGDPGGVRVFHLASNAANQLANGIYIPSSVFAAVNANGSLYALNTTSGISLYGQSGTTFASTPFNNISGGIAFSSDSTRLYTLDAQNDSLRFFDISNPFQPLQVRQLPIGEDLNTGSFNGRLALSPDGSRFFVTTASGIRVIDQPAHSWTPSVALDVPASAPRLENVTLTATVSPADPNAGSTIPTGTAYFYDQSQTPSVLLGTSNLVNGIATLTLNSFSVGQHSLAVTYSGDGNFSAASSSTSALTTVKLTPQLTVTRGGQISDGVFVPYYQTTDTVTFSPANLIGSNERVNLWDVDSGTLFQTVFINAGTASFAFTSNTEKEFNFRFEYTGNDDLNPTSVFFTVVCQKAATSVALIPPPSNSYILTAQTTPVSSVFNGWPLYGTISLLENDDILATVNGTPNTSFDLSSLSPGPHTLTVAYSGGNIFTGASETINLSVPVPTTTALRLSPTAPALNKPLTLNTSVSPAVSGNVSFLDNGNLIGSAPVSQGAASITFNPTTGGYHTYTATFAPDGNYLHTSATVSAYIYYPTTIDLLALYSNQELQAAGTVDAIRNRFTAQIDDANTVFANTGLAVSIRLAALVPANYSESGNLTKDWQRLENPADHYLDNVTALRNKIGTDLVVLLDAHSPVSTTNSADVVEGVASMLDANYFGYYEQDQIAFIVLAEDAPLSDYVLAHEIGHTLGIAHAANDPGSPGVAADARGYRTTYNGVTYRNVMAYDPGIIVPCFSNPDIVQSIGIRMGQSGSANAAHIIQITAPTLANYRSAPPFGAITAANASAVSGWVLDPKTFTQASDVRIDIDGIPAATISADDSYSPLLAQFGAAYHGFTYQLPTLTPGKHTVSVYALDAATGNPVFIGTKTVTAHHLAWTAQSASFVAGQSPTFTLAVKDASNHTVSSYQSTLTLSIFSGPAGGTLTGTISAPVINGIATFSSFTLTKSGAYTLRASDGKLLLNSRRFTVTPDAASAHLVLVSAAASEISLGQTAPPIIFNVQDQFANLVTTNRTPIVLTLLDSPSASKLSGSATLTLRNGIAKFSNLRPNKPGTYSLSFSDSLLPPTAPFSVLLTCLPAATTLPALRPARSYIAGKTITLSTTLSSLVSASTYPYTGTLTLTDSSDNTLATATLSSTGSAKFTLPTLAAGTYTCDLHYSGDPFHRPATSNTFTLLINPTV